MTPGERSAKPTTRHIARYRPGLVPAEADGRLHSPVFARNNPPIIAALAPFLAGRIGPALDIGSGTGQQATALALAFHGLDWWFSDPDPVHRASTAAWASRLGLAERPVLDLDGGTDWAADPAVEALGPLSAVTAINVIHVAPPAVMQGIFGGAARALAPGGILAFYGAMREHGRHVAPSNAAFDAGLRADDPDFGVRDIADLNALADAAGLAPAALLAMPANNRLALFRKP